MDRPGPHTLRLAGRTVDLRDGRIDGQGCRGHLTAFETELLRCLVDRAGEAVSRDELIARVWRGPVSDRAVDQAVRRLRRRLEPDRRHSSLVLSVRGIGYRFQAPREVVVRAPTSRLGSLDAWLRGAFAACCAFPGSFDAAAARHVAEVPEAVLRALVRHGLLEAVSDPTRPGARYAVVSCARIAAPADALARRATLESACSAAPSVVRSA